ncbi:MAG: dehydrogenase [ubiquinone] 1 alpha subcomplex assembly factor 1 [Candidatus Sumerlaeota bacterium]|nr:dehydrogenase [ubiquinone] 1 alpha subcomplex assembly factor 1 [Candidatus Sumerlaeota bacterium]
MKRFAALIALPLLGAATPADSVAPDSAEAESTNVLIDFRAEDAEDWTIIDDRRLFGRSRSSFAVSSNNTGVFAGVVKDSRGGGWCSVRRTFEDAADLGAAERIVLRVRGDGHTYGFDLRDDRSLAGVYYESAFVSTKDEWTTVELPLDSFRPMKMGSPSKSSKTLDAGETWSVAFVIAGGQTGPFRLEIEMIGWKTGE